MDDTKIKQICAAIERIQLAFRVGRVVNIADQFVLASGLVKYASIGDRVEISVSNGDYVDGEITAIEADLVKILVDGLTTGLRLNASVLLHDHIPLSPHESWLGRVINAHGEAMTGAPMLPGLDSVPSDQGPPNPGRRKPLGRRLDTGLRAFNTVLPIVRGQRVGLFAGSGVGKSSLLADLAKGLEADVVVVSQVGERGRELRHFVEKVLGPEAMARTVVVAATSDQSALKRRKSAWTAMGVAEYFRNQGKQVLLLMDSVTRFAEAHREIALANGEPPTLGGYPPSLAHEIMRLCERAGPGEDGQGDITAVFSVLVAGSDMDNPVADILRGVLDGHVVLDREIAERGRYPAINLVKSVSRSLPDAATDAENQLINRAREMLAVYDRSELMIQSGLYTRGSNTQIDKAISIWPQLDAFLSEKEPAGVAESFHRLSDCLEGRVK